MSWSFRAAALAAGLLCVPRPATAQDFHTAGPLLVGEQELVLDNPLAGTPLLRLTLLYPALASGAGTPPDTAHGPYPLVVFGHGFGNGYAPYAALLEHIASWGFVVAAPDSATWGPQGLLAQDLVGTRAAVLAFAEDPWAGAAFAGLLDDGPAGVTGHSMGGGAAVIAAALEPGFGAVLALAPWKGPPDGLTDPVQAAALLNVPLSIIVGSADDITPVATDSAPLYAAATGALPLRAMSVVIGAGHNDTTLLAQVGNDGTAFLEAYLRDDPSALDAVYGVSAQADPACVLAFEITAPDCFVTGQPAPSQTIALHVAGSTGSLLLGLLAPQAGGSTPAAPGLQLPAASLIVLGKGVAGPGQLLTLPLVLPPDFLALPQLHWFLQGLCVSPTGAVACSPLRTLVLQP